MKKNIFAFIICLFFVLIGILMIHKSKSIDQFEIGFANVIFFGLGLLVLPFIIAEEYRFKKELELQIQKISIPSGKRFFLDKIKPIGFLSVVFLSSVFFLVLSKRFSTLQIIFTGLCFFNFLFLILIFSKKLLNDFISISNEGIFIGKSSYYFIIRFENIKSISLNQFNSVTYICFEFLNPEDCTRYLFVKGSGREKTVKKIYRTFQNGIQYFGYPYFFSPERFKLSSALFYRLIEFYLKNPERISELKNE